VLSEIEARIENIRAERRGEGRTLTPKQARALAAEWYQWFTSKHLAKPKSAAHWEEEAWVPYDLYREAVWGSEPWPEGRDEDEDWWDTSPKARAGVRATVADAAETAQFLHTKRFTLDIASREMFLDHMCPDFFAAIEFLKRRARGDYGPDKYAEQFPAFERTGDPGLAPWLMFKQWIDETKPAQGTVARWRTVFLKLKEDFATCVEITPEAAQAWARGLVTGKRTEATVHEVWVNAARTVFGWANDQRLVGQNPFAEVRIKVPRKISTREKTFTTAEIRTILSAAVAIAKPRTKMEAAKRWLPWLCAYTGARAGEIAQLRGTDCVEQEGVHAIRITPEAGTIKTKQARVVPLHEHLIAQGFLKFAAASGRGPLFYSEGKTPPNSEDPTNRPKPRYTKVRERIAEWVRKLGVTDKEVKPNHAWRHTFKQVCDRHDISERVSDAITGHAAITVGRGYGVPSLKDKAQGLKRFPRYEVEAQTPEDAVQVWQRSGNVTPA
jgi:integrase